MTRHFFAAVALAAFVVPVGLAQHHSGGTVAPTPERPATLALDTARNGSTTELLLAVDDGGSQVLTHQRSIDGGVTWSTPVPIEASRGRLSGAGRGTDPQVAGAGDAVVALWMAKGSSSRGNGLMEAARSADGGRTWVSVGRPDDTASAVSQAFIDVTADAAGRFHAVWLDSRDGGQGLRLTASSDGGRTWTASSTIDARTCECCWNTISTGEAGSLLVLYRDKDPRDMAMARSTDGGRTWTRTSAVGAFSWGFNGCPHVGGALAAGETAGVVHAYVWTGEETALGAYVLTSVDDGRTWGAPVRVGPADAWHVDLARVGSRLIAAYDVNRPGDPHVAWAVSVDQGRTWQDQGRLSAPGVRASHPRIVVGAGRSSVVWTERSPEAVQTWKQATLLMPPGFATLQQR
jgi:hypothetical protein